MVYQSHSVKTIISYAMHGVPMGICTGINGLFNWRVQLHLTRLRLHIRV